MLLRRRELILAGGSLALLGAARAVADGPVRDLSWTDPARQRTLPLRLRLPAGDSATRVPLVLFSHGLGGSVDAGTVWAQAWARGGIATLHLQHPGSDRELLRDGLREGLRALRQAANVEQHLARAADVRFVLDELQRRQVAGEADLARLDLNAIGLAGHSFGSHTTLAVAGQGYGPSGQQGQLEDPRPRAFAAFSPSPGQLGTAEPERSFGRIRRPVLCLTGSLDSDPLASGPGSEARKGQGAWRREVYDGLPAGNKAELWLDAADHMTFGGHDIVRPEALTRPRLAGRMGQRAPETLEQQGRHRGLIEAVTGAWWWAHLRGDAASLAALARGPEGMGPRDAWRRG